MTIDKMMDELLAIRDEIGGDHEVAVVINNNHGENDYFIPKYGMIDNVNDLNGNTFKCVFVSEKVGEEQNDKNRFRK